MAKNCKAERRLASWEARKTTRLPIGGKVIAKKKMHWNLLPEDSERSEESSREGDGDPLQYSWLENPMDGGAWWAAVHAVVKSRTQLSDFTFTFQLSCTGEGNGNPLQCSCLENPRDGGTSWAAVYGVAQSRTRLKRLSSSRGI